MKLLGSSLFAVLVSTVQVASAREGQGTVSHEDDQNISIYSFDEAMECHHILRDYGACGISMYFKGVDQEASFVAMPAKIFDEHGSAQNNELCGQTIRITHQGVSRTAIVADRNLSPDNSIDTCLDIWQAFGGHKGDGTLIRGASWVIGEL
ncbi:hypothetical protein LEL_10574 [Akanthomyces lecanii RCEF 1005]|uniref:Ecp2 effector protein domain-containing protein n=1 Tax=Akanthomyces lecanii RCEF 1005 TaxID=1081108 RepID=A0A167XLM5_CORDF|nr:hypothetical protein LEL_10574 [Akanthomyces lecanii RCEF 1005]